MCKKILKILRSKMCLSRLWYIQYADMIHLSTQVKLVDLETLQVIGKSNWHYTSLDETMKSSQPEFMQTHHFRLKFYAANIIFTCIY